MDVDSSMDKTHISPTFQFGQKVDAKVPPQEAQPQVAFNIGKSDKKKRSPSGRRRDRQRRHGNGFAVSSVPKPAGKPAATKQEASRAQRSSMRYQEQSVSATGTQRSNSGTNPGADNSQRLQYVLSLREEARTAYCQSEYKLSVIHYTRALDSYPLAAEGWDNLRAILQANRGAALLMLGATDATVYCCQEALKFVSDTFEIGDRITSDRGPLLKVKVLTRLGRALYKCGRLDEATEAFQRAINTSDKFRALVKDNLEYIRMFESARGDAAIGKLEVDRCRKEIKDLEELGLNDLRSPMTKNKRDNNHALNKVKMALSFASESEELTTLMVVILACLKRWREIASVLERMAVKAAKLDGCFQGDLQRFNPTPGLPNAFHLPADFFDKDDARVLKFVRLEATAEVATRLPPAVAPAYLRALRLEERYKNADSAINAIEANIPVHKRAEYAWLWKEKDKLKRTHTTKDTGDTLFKDGEYEKAIDKYSTCLKIDGEDLPPEMTDTAAEAGNGGGKLHSVLHCNRAASFMQINKYEEALKDCEAALRIHPNYMKAILRRSRCYWRLKRYDESVASFEEYFKLAEDAKATDEVVFFLNANCIFDTPRDIDANDIARAKNEFLQVKEAKLSEENEARAQKYKREQSRAWYQSNFGSEASARDRRERWYNDSSGSRRWDSFNNGSRGPSGSGQQGATNRGGASFRQQHSSSSSAREEPRRQAPPNNGSYGNQRNQSQSRGRAHRAGGLASPVSDANSTHYSVLELARTASGADIKKAYKKMALKYHPDKNQSAGAEDKFRRVKAAYDILSDPRSRRTYDDEIRWRR